MRIGALIREALAAAWAAKIPSGLVALVAAAMCFVALSTVGQIAANTQESGFINTRTLNLVANLSTVQTAVAIGAPFDTVNGRIGSGGPPVAAWPVHGNLAQVGTLLRGRWPRPGEAVVTAGAMRRLGLAVPIGYVTTSTSQQYPIVGKIAAIAPFDDFADGIVVNAADDPTANELRVVISAIPAVPATQKAVLTILAPRTPAACTSSRRQAWLNSPKPSAANSPVTADHCSCSSSASAPSSSAPWCCQTSSSAAATSVGGAPSARPAPISPPWSPFAPSPPPPSVHWSAASPRVSSTPVRATRPHWTSPWPLPFLLC